MKGYTASTYLAVIALIVVALGAVGLILHAVNGNHTNAALGNEAQYQGLQQSILGK